MKKTLLTAIVLGTSILTQAQETDLLSELDIKERKNEIGLTMQSDMLSRIYNSNTLQAIQYKRWKNPHFGARFLLGRSTYQTDQDFSPTYTTDNDTVVRKLPITNGTMVFAGVGVEAQRTFYKRVVLFAAVEARFGFGDANIDTAVEYSHSSYREEPFSKQRITPTGRASIFQAGISPSIGGKIEFKRINFGTELAMNLINYTQIEYAGQKASGNLSVDISQLNPRFFVHYRF